MASKLNRIYLSHNANYKKNGLKSYVFALRKCTQGRFRACIKGSLVYSRQTT